MFILRRARWASLGLASLVLSACGTTLPLTTTADGAAYVDPLTGEVVSGDGTLAPDGSVIGANGEVIGGVSGSAGKGSGAGGSAGAASGGSSAPGSASPSAGGSATPPPGARNTSPISVGVVVVNFGALVSSVGGDGDNDVMAPYKAYVAEANKQGGLAGRKIMPVYYEIDGSGNQATAQQAACQFYTQDNKVEAVIGGNVGNNFTACLGKAGIPYFVNDPIFSGDAQDLNTFPNLYNSGAPTTDRAAVAMLDQAVATKWLTSENTLGVLLSGCPWGPRVFESIVAPRAKSAGVEVVRFSMGCSAEGGSGSVQEISAAVSNAILQFRQAGVDRVMVLNGNGDAPTYLLFTTNADSQNYSPGYITGSNAVPAAFYAGGLVSEAQASKTRGSGWMPVLDDNRQVTQLAKNCDEMVRKGGAPAVEAPGQYGQICDVFTLLAAALKLSNGAGGQAAISSAVARLGTSYSSTVTIGGATSFSSAKRDSVAVTRPFAFNSGCDCFSYNGAPQRVAGS